MLVKCRWCKKGVWLDEGKVIQMCFHHTHIVGERRERPEHNEKRVRDKDVKNKDIQGK